MAIGTQVPGLPIPTPITGFPAAESVTGTDVILIVSSGQTKKATIAQALAAAGAAPADAQYLVLDAASGLTAERVLQFVAQQFTTTDNGAGSTYVVALNFADQATPLTDAAAADKGTSPVPARSDHRHPINVSSDDPVPVASTASPGIAPTYARSDHNHGAVPAFQGATAGADGTLGGVVKPLAGQQDYYLRADGTWQILAGTGTVTSVAMTVPSFLSVAGSPITTSGTLAVTLATQVANTVFSGPSAGADAAPTFRALVAADIPSLDAGKITTGTLAIARGGTSAGTAQGARLAILPAVAGQANKALVVNAGETDFDYVALTTGTVTSVGLAGTAAEITVTGSTPITGAGSWTLSLPTALTFTGKTVTGGTFSGVAIGSSSTIDNTVIGGSTPAAGTFTTLLANTSLGVSVASPRGKADILQSGTANTGTTSTGLVLVGPSVDPTAAFGIASFESNSDQGASVGPSVTFSARVTDASTDATGIAQIQAAKENGTSGNRDSFLRAIIRTEAGGLVEVWRANKDGFGVGESAPDYKLDVNGTFGFAPGSSVTPVDNGDVVIEFTDNTTLTFKAKGSDGTVRSATLTLAP